MSLPDYLSDQGITYVSRDQWKARPPKYLIGLPEKRIAQLHHAAARFSSGLIAESAAMRAVQNAHMDGHGWSDIAYGFGIGSSGNVYEGRGLDRKGGGAGDPADNWGIALLMLANFHQDPPTYVAQKQSPEMRRSLSAVWAYLRDVEGYDALKPHRELSASVCPGNTITAPYVDPFPPHTPDPEEDEMTEKQYEIIMSKLDRLGSKILHIEEQQDEINNSLLGQGEDIKIIRDDLRKLKP